MAVDPEQAAVVVEMIVVDGTSLWERRWHLA
jgi:hypothetical protein